MIFFTAIRKEARLFCGSFLRKGKVFAYVGLSQNLKEIKAGSLRSFTEIRKDAGFFCASFSQKGEVFAYVGSIRNLKDLKDPAETGTCAAAVLCLITLQWLKWLQWHRNAGGEV